MKKPDEPKVWVLMCVDFRGPMTVQCVGVFAKEEDLMAQADELGNQEDLEGCAFYGEEVNWYAGS